MKFTFGRWRLVTHDSGGQVDVYVLSPEYGEVIVGSLFLNDEDSAELLEIFGARP